MEECLVYTIDTDTRDLVCLDAKIRVPATKGIIGAAMQCSEVLVVQDVPSCALYHAGEFGAVSAKNVCAVSIRFGSDPFAGIVALNKDSEFTAEDSEMLSLFALFAGAALRNVTLFTVALQQCDDVMNLMNLELHSAGGGDVLDPPITPTSSSGSAKYYKVEDLTAAMAAQPNAEQIFVESSLTCYGTKMASSPRYTS